MNNETECLDLHGWGTLVNDFGTMITEGYFQNGTTVGKCRQINLNTMYEGELLDNIKHGAGEETEKDAKFKG